MAGPALIPTSICLVIYLVAIESAGTWPRAIRMLPAQ
jgi:hypothetical protein